MSGRAVKKMFVWAAIAGVAAAVIYYGMQDELTKVSKEGLLVASGRIEGTEVRPGSRMAGRVVEVLFEEGRQVEKGQALVRIESDQMKLGTMWAESELRKGMSQLAAGMKQLEMAAEQATLAQTQLELAQETVPLQIEGAEKAREAARANVEQAKAQMEYAKATFGRASTLEKSKVAPTEALDMAQAQFGVTRAMVDGAEKLVAQAEAALKGAKAGEKQIAMAAAQLRQARLQVEAGKHQCDAGEASVDSARAMVAIAKSAENDCEIRSPISGVAVARLVEPGEILSGSSPVAVIVDMDKLHLKVYIPSAEAGQVKLNDRVRVYPDAMPDKAFEAYVADVSQQAEFTPKNVETREQRTRLVFGVKLAFKDNADRQLKPGMPAEAVIRWKENVEWEHPTRLR
ncbi:MAG TPA: efflux RND transporter periplasmic adaptor subunit [Candidatus Brocadiia bacterium]|nr:efflux RND transporter periplasmic adaptor subunit [Candidatus Brocadiia bacterium]